MQKIPKTLSLIAPILLALSGGCAFDLTAVRPGESLQISARPTASPPTNFEDTNNARASHLLAPH